MALRWVASALSDAATRMRKLRVAARRCVPCSRPSMLVVRMTKAAPSARPRSITPLDPSPATVQQAAGHRPHGTLACFTLRAAEAQPGSSNGVPLDGIFVADQH
jgi:hypothetical protein